jgi:hypothetical protein
MPGLSDQVMQHFVPDDHLVHRPVTGEEDVVVLPPVTRALTAGAGKARSLDDRPAEPIEVSP